MGKALYGLLLTGAAFLASPAWGQATTRSCGAEESVGPACLAARQVLPALPKAPVFWHIDRFVGRKVAERAAAPTSTVVEAFDGVWLFTIADERWRSRGGTRVSAIGPLPVRPAARYAAEYLRSVFSPGMTAPLHVHSGPEAFFAISGDTCLETPAGVRTGRGPGNSLMIEAGPPMLLMAIGKEPRRGFALILHGDDQPPTTLIHDWHPQGLCARQFAQDQGRPAP